MEDKFDFSRRVSRASFELGERHGWGAEVYATKLAMEAKAEGDGAESLFWSSVANHLKLRSVQSK